MGNLKKTDFLMALIFGILISLLCFLIQSPKNNHKRINKKKVQQLSLSSDENPKSYSNSLVIKSKNAQKKAPAIKNDSLTHLEKSNEYINPKNKLADEASIIQVGRKMSIIDRNLENYLFHQIGLSEKEISRVLYSKKLMEDELFKNTQGFINPTDEDSTALNNLNQQTLFYYNEELKQILGPENYQKYYKWQGEQDVAMSERE